MWWCHSDTTPGNTGVFHRSLALCNVLRRNSAQETVAAAPLLPEKGLLLLRTGCAGAVTSLLLTSDLQSARGEGIAFPLKFRSL